MHPAVAFTHSFEGCEWRPPGLACSGVSAERGWGMTRIKSAVAASGRRAPHSARLGSASTRTIGAVLAALLMTHDAGAAEPIIGQASVIDGDTIEIAGERVQLNSVDAPEEWQVCLDERGADYRCGKESASALDAFLSASRPTRCAICRPRSLWPLRRNVFPGRWQRREPLADRVRQCSRSRHGQQRPLCIGAANCKIERCWNLARTARACLRGASAG